MSSGTELLWPGVALLLLGVAASLCVRCSRPGAKRSEKIYEQRSLGLGWPGWPGGPADTPLPFAVVGHPWPGPLVDTVSDKLLQFSPDLEDPASCRYQNFRKGSRHGSDTGYIDPIARCYYDRERFPKPSEDDDDTNSYENVLICKPRTSGEAAQLGPKEGSRRHSSLALGTGRWPPLLQSLSLCSSADNEECEDYQNSASIRQWRESRRAVGRWLRAEAPPSPGSPEEDGEPDYVNGDVAGEA
uniref:Linker for activation of T cells family member 2 n=1 Tax=Microcebus murinus TaxID=30608 RepID=A0A8C5XUI9_MICMU